MKMFKSVSGTLYIGVPPGLSPSAAYGSKFSSSSPFKVHNISSAVVIELLQSREKCYAVTPRSQHYRRCSCYGHTHQKLLVDQKRGFFMVRRLITTTLTSMSLTFWVP